MELTPVTVFVHFIFSAIGGHYLLLRADGIFIFLTSLRWKVNYLSIIGFLKINFIKMVNHYFLVALTQISFLHFSMLRVHVRVRVDGASLPEIVFGVRHCEFLIS